MIAFFCCGFSAGLVSAYKNNNVGTWCFEPLVAVVANEHIIIIHARMMHDANARVVLSFLTPCFHVTRVGCFPSCGWGLLSLRVLDG